MRPNLIASLVILGQVGCQDGPRLGKAHAAANSTSEAEPALATANAEICEFDPPPLLVITSRQALLDGVPVDEATLQSVLQEKQNVQALIAGPIKREILVQVDAGVSESRVRRFLSNARGAGFSNVTRTQSRSR
jgi:hypothetical protein